MSSVLENKSTKSTQAVKVNLFLNTMRAQFKKAQ